MYDSSAVSGCRLSSILENCANVVLGKQEDFAVTLLHRMAQSGQYVIHEVRLVTNTLQSLAFPVITKLQSLSNHLALTIPNAAASHDAQDRSLAFLKEMVPEHWEELYRAQDSIVNLGNPEFCGKVGGQYTVEPSWD